MRMLLGKKDCKYGLRYSLSLKGDGKQAYRVGCIAEGATNMYGTVPVSKGRTVDCDVGSYLQLTSTVLFILFDVATLQKSDSDSDSDSASISLLS